MIHLDTNVLIRMMASDRKVLQFVGDQLAAGEELVTSSVAWYGFKIVPVDKRKLNRVTQFLRGKPTGFNNDLADAAAELFNATGRARSRKMDTTIAATAIANGRRLATGNVQDFRCFEKLGLEILEV